MMMVSIHGIISHLVGRGFYFPDNAFPDEKVEAFIDSGKGYSGIADSEVAYYFFSSGVRVKVSQDFQNSDSLGSDLQLVIGQDLNDFFICHLLKSFIGPDSVQD